MCKLDARRLARTEPVILQSRGRDIVSDHTLVIACGPYFDQRVPNAGVTYRLGLARGFEQLGIPYELVSVSNFQRVTEIRNPIVFLTEGDFEFLSRTQILELRQYKHFVWVNHWFEGATKLYREHDFEQVETSQKVRARVMESTPDFVFGSGTRWGFEHYQGWVDHGMQLISLPLACDTTLYRRSNAPRMFDVQMGFVGGYWPYKARNFDLYLKPHEQRLTVFGYSKWPYAGYGGLIAEKDEPLLYRDAVLCPAINEPHAAVLGGDICERVYKVLGSHGLCITDVTPAHRDIFKSDEVLMPESVAEYHDMVHEVFEDPDAFNSYRENGYRAIQDRHTYRHRAEDILKWLGLSNTYQKQSAYEVARW